MRQGARRRNGRTWNPETTENNYSEYQRYFEVLREIRDIQMQSRYLPGKVRFMERSCVVYRLPGIAALLLIEAGLSNGSNDHRKEEARRTSL